MKRDYKKEAIDLREALESMVRVGEHCVDPDEPFNEWVSGLEQALDEAQHLLRTIKYE
jgi:hypothetical protein